MAQDELQHAENNGGANPSKLYIRVFEKEEQQPAQTIAIPLGILKWAQGVIPDRAKTAMREAGIDIDQVMTLADNAQVPGVLVEFDDHKKRRRVIISVE